MIVANSDDPRPSYYGELQRVFNQAVDFLHGRTKSGRKYSQTETDLWVSSQLGEGSPIRTFKQLATTLQNLESTGARPVEASDLSPIEKGAIARTVRFGHAVVPFTDEIAGALSFLTPGGEGFREGRDVNRRYLDNALEQAVNRGILNPDWWGAAAGALASGGAGAPGVAATAPSLARAGAAGAGYGLGYTAGELPEQDIETYRENWPALALNPALGAVAGVGGATIARRTTALRQPGPLKLDKALEAAGGEAGVTRAVAETGVERPMLAELQETTFGRLGREIRMASQEAQTAALRRVEGELASVQAQKAAVSQQYRILGVPITSKRAADILTKPRVQALVKTLVRDGVVQPGQVTGRALEDIRQELSAAARRAYARKNGRVGKLLNGYARELQGIVDGSIQGMSEIRALYAPLAQREATLQGIARQLSREARRSGIPVESRVTAKSEFLQDLGSERWQREMRAARQMVEPLYTPGAASEHLARLRAGMPWYSRLGGATGGPGAALVPQLTEPFFPLRQVSDSGR